MVRETLKSSDNWRRQQQQYNWRKCHFHLAGENLFHFKRKETRRLTLGHSAGGAEQEDLWVSTCQEIFLLVTTKKKKTPSGKTMCSLSSPWSRILHFFWRKQLATLCMCGLEKGWRATGMLRMTWLRMTFLQDRLRSFKLPSIRNESAHTSWRNFHFNLFYSSYCIICIPIWIFIIGLLPEYMRIIIFD